MNKRVPVCAKINAVYVISFPRCPPRGRLWFKVTCVQILLWPPARLRVRPQLLSTVVYRVRQLESAVNNRRPLR